MIVRYGCAVCIVVPLLCMVHCLNIGQYRREEFETEFHRRCDKYAFVNKFVEKLEYTDERYFTFVYQEPGLKNGGLGDRIGGLISAVAMSIRFNRTLLLRSHNSMHEIFRPYHPTDIHSPNPKYSWDNVTSWSNFNVGYTNNDNTEYDLYDCINHTGQKNSHCSMSTGDASTPLVLFRANRCFLCFYENNPSHKAFSDMRNILGVPLGADLYEVAGCMMRLALWPTNKLWDEVNKNLDTMLISTTGNGSRRRTAVADSVESRLQHQLSFHPTASAIRAKATSSKNVSSKPATQEVYVDLNASKDSILHESRGLRGCFTNNSLTRDFRAITRYRGYRLSPHTLRRRRTDEQTVEEVEGGEEEEEGGEGLLVFGTEDVSKATKVFQVGLHYRCGDLSYIHRGGFDHMCIYDPHDPPSAEKSGMYKLGNPYLLGLCARESLRNMSSAATKITPPPPPPTTTTTAVITDDTFVMSFVASDNHPSSLQMASTLNLKDEHTIISPQGCHVEMDQSAACHLVTVSQWFLLSLSDILITQEHMPSSFSRYAGIYGLKHDPFRNGLHCAEYQNSTEFGHQQVSNWFC